MSNPHLPPELLDLIVDLQHDTEDTLESCCLVSKSWIPRTRKHLFSHIEFHTPSRLRSWKTSFPDRFTSPPRYAKSLSVCCPQAVTAADAEGGGWIPTFSHIVRFEVYITAADGHEHLIPFLRFSPLLKSLSVTYLAPPSARILNFVYSFPLLEDLFVSACDRSPVVEDGDNLDVVQPSSPPLFTGSLELSGTDHIVPQLLSLPGGLYFWKLSLRWNHGKDVLLTRELVKTCCSTLESICIDIGVMGMPSLRSCLNRALTSGHRRAVVWSGRPLESNKTQRCHVYVFPGNQVDHLNTSNTHWRSQKFPINYAKDTLSTFYSGFRLFRLCQPWENDWRGGV